jgi:NAD+ diphosphatase
MLGFRAESANTEIDLRDHELEDARWYSRDEIRNDLKNGSLKLSPKVSISFRLIEEWFDQNKPGELLSILDSLPPSDK